MRDKATSHPSKKVRYADGCNFFFQMTIASQEGCPRILLPTTYYCSLTTTHTTEGDIRMLGGYVRGWRDSGESPD